MKPRGIYWAYWYILMIYSLQRLISTVMKTEVVLNSVPHLLDDHRGIMHTCNAEFLILVKGNDRRMPTASTTLYQVDFSCGSTRNGGGETSGAVRSEEVSRLLLLHSEDAARTAAAPRDIAHKVSAVLCKRYAGRVWHAAPPTSTLDLSIVHACSAC